MHIIVYRRHFWSRFNRVIGEYLSVLELVIITLTGSSTKFKQVRLLRWSYITEALRSSSKGYCLDWQFVEGSSIPSSIYSLIYSTLNCS